MVSYTYPKRFRWKLGAFKGLVVEFTSNNQGTVVISPDIDTYAVGLTVDTWDTHNSGNWEPVETKRQTLHKRVGVYRAL